MTRIGFLGLAATLIVGLTQGCYISRNLDQEVRVSFNKHFPITVENTMATEGFTSITDVPAYMNAFYEGLKSEFSSNKVVIDHENPEYKIEITSLVIKEESKEEIVDDPSSEDNGAYFVLSSLDYNCEGHIVKADGTSLGNWVAYKDRKEKVKDRTKNDGTKTYREKTMSDDSAKDLARMTGRRSGARIVNDIHRHLKQQDTN